MQGDPVVSASELVVAHIEHVLSSCATLNVVHRMAEPQQYHTCTSKHLHALHHIHTNEYSFVLIHATMTTPGSLSYISSTYCRAVPRSMSCTAWLSHCSNTIHALLSGRLTVAIVGAPRNFFRHGLSIVIDSRAGY